MRSSSFLDRVIATVIVESGRRCQQFHTLVDRVHIYSRSLEGETESVIGAADIQIIVTADVKVIRATDVIVSFLDLVSVWGG